MNGSDDVAQSFGQSSLLDLGPSTNVKANVRFYLSSVIDI